LEVDSFFMIKEDYIVGSGCCDEMLEGLDGADMDMNSLWYSGVVLDIFCNVCIFLVDFYCVDCCFGHNSAELQSWVSTVSTYFQYIPDIFTFDIVLNNLYFFRADIHHPVLGGKSINLGNCSFEVVFLNSAEDMFQKGILYCQLWYFDDFVVGLWGVWWLSGISFALFVWHID
jgi:hypothetical protein